jgi:hypothetical protein
VASPTTISFTAQAQGSPVIYRSDDAGQYNVPTNQNGAGDPAVGFERNGRFFS